VPVVLVIAVAGSGTTEIRAMEYVGDVLSGNVVVALERKKSKTVMALKVFTSM
jgi:hypothetical protein